MTGGSFWTWALLGYATPIAAGGRVRFRLGQYSAYGPVLGVPVGLALAVATLLIVVPFLVWLVIFIGLPN